MADLKYYDIILKPVVTEKSMNDMAMKRYTFYVHYDATKNQVRDAVEKMFDGTKVKDVNTMICATKMRRARWSKNYGPTVQRKKAIVTLTPDSKEIVIFQGM